MGKGEIACYEQFLLFPQNFQKTCTAYSKNHDLFGKGLTTEPGRSFNPLPDDKILDWSKLKLIADDISKCI